MGSCLDSCLPCKSMCLLATATEQTALDRHQEGTPRRNARYPGAMLDAQGTDGSTENETAKSDP
jgi:hypothetical protein